MRFSGEGSTHKTKNKIFSNKRSEKTLKKNLKLQHSFKAHKGTIMSMKFNDDGTHLITCGKDRKVLLWNPIKHLCIKTYEGHGYEVRSVAFTSDSSKLTTVGADKQFFVWDTINGKIVRKFSGHDLPINSVSYAAEDQVIITGSEDKTLKIWDCRSRTPNALQTVNAFRDSISSLIVSCERQEIFAASVDGTIRRFDIRAEKIVSDEIQHAVTSIALSNDGECILAACLDSTLRLIERNHGKLLKTYVGHRNVGVKIDCCFRNNDDQVVIGSEDGLIYIWDFIEAVIDQKLDTGIGPVISIATQPTGQILATGGVDGVVKIWG